MTDKPADELATIWDATRSDLRASVLDSTFELWLAPLRPAALRGGTLYLTAPPTITSWVERRYASMIADAAGRHSAEVNAVAMLPAGQDLPAGAGDPEPERALNPEYTFSRFVIGAGTRLAHAAALAVAESPAEAYNPLFLFGPPGLGKTHLLGAIANYTAGNHPDLSVRSTTAERFTNEFVTALRAEGLDDFKRRHRELDLLLIDDVQFLAGKVRTAEEFFHTFNALHEAGSQIVLSSDRPPGDLEPLAERLRDRFDWGMLAELKLPDLATRQVILRRLAREAELPAESGAALDSLAASSTGNVRRLQGALTRLIAHSSLHGRPIDAELAGDMIARESPGPGAEAPIERIKTAVGARLGVDVAQLAASGRSPLLVRARHIAIYLSRELTDLSLPRIGVAFDRDHTTVLHAIRKIEREAAIDAQLAEAIDALRMELRTSTSLLPDRDHCENRQRSHSGDPQSQAAARSKVHRNQQGQSPLNDNQ